MEIRKAAVIGAGVMGGGIAAHIANAGVPVLLLDRLADGGRPVADARPIAAVPPIAEAVSNVRNNTRKSRLRSASSTSVNTRFSENGTGASVGCSRYGTSLRVR